MSVPIPAAAPRSLEGSRKRRFPFRRPGRHAWGYLFILPAACALGISFVYPLVRVVRFSFQSGSLDDLTDVGFENYASLWDDPVFIRSVVNNLKLLISVPIMTALALIIALILNGQVRGWRQYRAIVFLPYILPATAVGLVFSYLLTGNGVLNTLLRRAHLGVLTRDWLGTADHVVPTIGSVIIWQQLGFGIVVFSAALLAVPQELVEAARIDGATSWQIQRLILIPQIRRVIEFFMVLEAITVLSSIFAYVFVLTKAGPAGASSVVEYYVFQRGFQNGAIGIASAAVVVLLLFVSVLMALYIGLQRTSGEAAR